MTAAYSGHLKASIFIFLLGILAAGLVVAEENDALSSRTFAAAEVGLNFDYGNDQMAEHAIDERIIDRLGLFDPCDSGQSSRYSLSLDLENEDSDWSFESLLRSNFDSNIRQRGQAGASAWPIRTSNFSRYRKFFVVTASNRCVAA